MTAKFMVILMRACGCAFFRVVIVHDETRMDDSRYPAEQRQNEAEEETRDAPGHQHRQWRKNHAEKISQGFHYAVFLFLIVFVFLSLSFPDLSFNNS